MTLEANSTHLRMEHADWLRDKAVHFRSLAAGAVPSAVAEDLHALALKYERLAAALEPHHAAGAGD